MIGRYPGQVLKEKQARKSPTLKNLFSTSLSSSFGTLYLLWQETEGGPKVLRVLLPNEKNRLEQLARRVITTANFPSCPPIARLGEQIQRFLKGEALTLDLNLLALETCPDFQRRVLLAEHGIPRGWVSTYGRIARNLGHPKSARAVGRALALNPFPIIIPCHRAVRADGELGGFRGGLKMKRALLELEGVEFSPTGKVCTSRVYY